MLAEGENVILLDRQGRQTLARLAAGRKVVTHRGAVALDEAIGQPDGIALRTTTGDRVTVFRPRLMDYALEMPRTTGLIYPKDAAFILLWADIFPGARVLEAGIGSGALTLSLLRAIGPSGALVCYDIRPDFIARALANLERYYGQPPSLLVRERDVYAGIVDTGLDRVILDVPEPWRVVESAAAGLQPGGIFCAYNPSIVQVQQTAAALRGHGGYAAVETLEVLYRGWVVRDEVVRPEQQMIGHTGFLTLARRTARDVHEINTAADAPDPD